MKVWLPLVTTGTGAEVFIRRLAKGLRQKGHDVTLDVVPHYFQYAPWLAGLRAPPDTDVIFANSWTAAAFAGPAPLVTVVYHVVHDPLYAPYRNAAQAIFHRGFVRPMEMRALRNSQAAIAISETTAFAIRAHLLDIPLDIVLPGIDTGFFCPPPVRSLQTPSAPIELLFVGKPSRRKAFDLVAEIVSRLGTACRLTCVGQHPGRDLPKPFARYLGRVSEDELRNAYQEADVLLFPSRLEGFGYAAAEAMACGLPVVCAEGSAVAEIVPSPDCGIACPPNDPAAFAYAVWSLKQDRTLLANMSWRARVHAVEHLALGRWIDETESVLKRAARLPLPARARGF